MVPTSLLRKCCGRASVPQSQQLGIKLINVMNIEYIEKQQKEEEEQKIRGTEKIENFLERVVGNKNINNPDFFIDLLGKMDYEQFISYLKRVNGIVKEIPIKDRGAFKNESGVVNTSMMESTPEIVPPKKEKRIEIMKEVFDKLKNLALSDREDKKEIISRSIFNSIIYLHPFNDGNGRTARTLYFLTSPIFKNSKAEWKLNYVVKRRTEGLKEYHENINLVVYRNLLQGKGIEWMNNGSEEESVWPEYEDDSPVSGFDRDYLGFLAAYQAMSKDERNKYITNQEDNKNKLSVNEENLSDELKAKIKVEKEKIREEFARKIIDMSFDPEWPEWLEEELEEAFLKI
jgi:hypothetical protein